MADPPVVVVDSPSLGYRIDRLFAYVAEDGDGEGLVGAPIGSGGSLMPLVGADAERMLSLRPFARTLARAVPGRRIRLVRFDVRTEIEEIVSHESGS